MQVQTKGIRSIFEPRALALIGVTEDPQSPGHIILRNLLEGGYQGRLFAIGPERVQVLGLPVHRALQDIDQAIDLALIAAPAEALSAAIEQCGKRRMAGALIYDHGLPGRRGEALNQRLADEAQRYGLRLLGPQSHGIARPAIGLNATFTYSKVTPGKVALVSQSGALVSAILDWAGDNAIGFSSVISLGSASDIAFWESLDYLAADPQTDSILLYVEGIRHRRRFMSSLRAAARTKPVIVFKAGRQPAGSQAALTHSRAMVGSDQVFNAALSRAGAVRVDSFVQLFSAAQCLSSRYRAFGNRIAIVSNGAGPGIIAADWATDCGIEIAAFAPETLTRLEAALPAGSSRANPLDLLSDAGPQRYGQILSICLEDSQLDGVLAILTPQPASQPMQTAEALIQLSRAQDKPVVACWMGDAQVQPARATLAQALVPTFRTPEPAVESFSHVAGYYRNQKLLMQVPGPLSRQEPPDLDGAKLVIEIALGERRKVLNEMESKALLAAFRIPVAHTMIARSASEAIMIAEQIGFPVALKVSSPDIAHKSAVNGVRLNVANARAAHSAYL
ncbi:MAG TPA: acetate--CoA ligase family protein, partial [Burkholderiales bacterium]|nr:acetate--CoA ligase family protein [Burkholderiales bacterium]